MAINEEDREMFPMQQQTTRNQSGHPSWVMWLDVLGPMYKCDFCGFETAALSVLLSTFCSDVGVNAEEETEQT